MSPYLSHSSTFPYYAEKKKARKEERTERETSLNLDWKVSAWCGWETHLTHLLLLSPCSLLTVPWSHTVPWTCQVLRHICWDTPPPQGSMARSPLPVLSQQSSSLSGHFLATFSEVHHPFLWWFLSSQLLELCPPSPILGICIVQHIFFGYLVL